MSDCTHNCDTCSQNCGEKKDPKSFLLSPKPEARIGKVFAIVSGKGGVGKSMVTSQLAVATHRKGYSVGIMDADITGPSIPRAFGVQERPVSTGEALHPSRSASGIQIMSINLLLDNETDPVIWRGPVITGVSQQFWTEVLWDVDYLFIDLPPGTGDVPLHTFQTIPLNGIILVTSPQDLVAMVVEKAVNMAKIMNIPIVGLVENMSYAVCPDCGKKLYLFGEGKTEEAARRYKIPMLAQLPIDPGLAERMDCGEMEQLEDTQVDSIVETLEIF